MLCNVKYSDSKFDQVIMYSFSLSENIFPIITALIAFQTVINGVCMCACVRVCVVLALY